MGAVASSFIDPFKSTSTKPSKRNVLYYANQVTAEAFLEVAETCASAVESSQLVSLECDPNQAFGRQEDTEECIECLRNAEQYADSQFILQRETWKKTGDYFVAANIDSQFESFIATIDYCNTACKTCNFENTSQMAYIEFDQECKFSDEMVTQFQTSVSGKFKSSLYSRQDIAGALVSSVSGSNANETIANVTDLAASQITAAFADNMVQGLNLSQTINLKSGGTTVFSGIQQDVVLNQLANIVGENNSYANVLTETQWDAWANSWQSDTTLDSVGNVLNDTVNSFSDLINSTIGGVMFGLMILLGCVVIGLIIFIAVKESRNKK